MSWFQSLLYGVDLDEEQARSNELDQALARENKADLQNGTFDQTTYDVAEIHRTQGELPHIQSDVEKEFASGFDDGIRNVRTTIGSAVSLPFSIIPWQVYLLGALALFWYMGGGVFIRGIFRK